MSLLIDPTVSTFKVGSIVEKPTSITFARLFSPTEESEACLEMGKSVQNMMLMESAVTSAHKIVFTVVAMKNALVNVGNKNSAEAVSFMSSEKFIEATVEQCKRSMETAILAARER
jgi:hypothetical protein